MMAVLAAILPVVATSSSLALKLYRVAAGSKEAAKELIRVAKVVNHFALNLKQIGTIIKEDDRLPSYEAIGNLEDVTVQAQTVLDGIKSAISTMETEQEERRHGNGDSRNDNLTTGTRLGYLSAHLEALSATLSVQVQTLYAAQSIMWSKLRPTISPQQTARAVTNERLQLQTLIVEQQLLILFASKTFEEDTLRGGGRLLMETDSSQSLVASIRGDMPSFADLHRYQDPDIARLDIVASDEASWLQAVSSISASHSEHLLEKWTSLPQFDDRVRNAEREAQKQKQENQQATVESDGEEDDEHAASIAGGRAQRRRSASVQPLFTDANLASPSTEQNNGPSTPLSSAASLRTSRISLGSSTKEQESPTSPRSSIGSLPVEAAAAVEAKEEDDDVDLEIPWTLCTRKYYWKYIDARQVGGNTDQPPSLAFLERSSWTEILASWVCKEAIREAGYRYTPVRKERKDGRRTKFETLFLIEKPLQFDQVKHLVERTVELYRKTAPPTPPLPQVRRSSFNRTTSQINDIDRDRTPRPRDTYPQLERPNNSKQFAPPPGPPSLDRSASMPRQGLPPPPPLPQPVPYPRSSNLQIPMPGGSYIPQLPPRPTSPRLPTYPTQPHSYNPQHTYPTSPHPVYPPNNSSYSSSLPPHLQRQSGSVPQAPLRPRHLHPHTNTNANSRYEDTTTSESESGDRDWERDRRRRSKSRSKESSRYKEDRRKKGRTSKAAGALIGVGGLTALLDGLSGL